MKNRKGFTLVELMAVIAILAILMVSAGTGVMAVINNSKINSFKNEVMVMVRGAESMYTAVSMDASNYANYVAKSTNKKAVAICITLPGLVSNGYLDKDIKTYGGVILVEVPTSTGQPRTTVWIHNGKYGINGIEATNIDALRFKKENNILGRNIGSGNSGDTANVPSGGPIGLVTNLTGIKTIVSASYGTTQAVGVPAGLVNGTKTSGPGLQIEASYTAGITGNVYVRVPCINTKL